MMQPSPSHPERSPSHPERSEGSLSNRGSLEIAQPRILAQIEDDARAEVAHEFVDIAADYFADSRDRSSRSSTQHAPATLAARFDEPIPRTGAPIREIIERLRTQVMPDSNHLWHPRYVGHQMAGPVPAAVWAESVTGALNQSVAVFEMSPIGTVIEHRVIAWMNALVGFGPESGGTLTSGGTEATFTALLAARNAAIPDAWTNGVGADPPLLFCGEHTHYAATRAGAELGLGMKSVIPVRSRNFKLDPDALASKMREQLTAGRRAMAVVATAGSTATGSFDDLETIAALCDEFGIWLHVDGAHGASALLSPKHRFRLRGIERARSIAWDPHKMMLIPSPSSMVLVRDERDLDRAFSQRAPYLFHDPRGDRAWDQGTRSFMCTRRADVLKLWVALQRYGVDGFAELHDYFCALTRFMWEEIAERNDFEALHEPESNILCFRYIPSPANGRKLDDAAVDEINRELRERYNKSGEGWITATNLAGRRVLRVTVMNPRTTTGDIRDTLDGLAAIGRALA
jgi:L-2,4-diaminobutyrate decarboxylase